MRVWKLWLIAFVGLGCAALRQEHGSNGATIDITRHDDNRWSVEYTLASPTDRLIFQRSPDTSRSQSWIAPPGFELVSTEDGEVVRRTDGQKFGDVNLQVPPNYRDLPKDYAPFAPFGDGGALFHTGRFFACAKSCEESPSWRMSLDAPDSQNIIIDGQVVRGHADWLDNGDGRNVYVGVHSPVDTGDLISVMDDALPIEIRSELDKQLPAFMRFFARRLGSLDSRPMLFASYDASHPGGGWGRQGGTLPGQIFTHFYGSAWSSEMAKPDFASDLAWHFAHEAAHLYQRQIYSDSSADSWIHEGGAEMLAAFAMKAASPAAAQYVDHKLVAAGVECRSQLAGRSMSVALQAGEFQVAYSCGLLLNTAIDKSLRERSETSDGLIDVWNAIIREKGNTLFSEVSFLAILSELGGADLAAQVSEQVRSTKPDFQLIAA